LNGLRAFEAAGRNGSFSLAAKELNVTPAAVSRLVRDLEARLGFALFKREANKLDITSRGRMLLSGLSEAFDAIAQLADKVAAVQSPSVLTVGVGPAIAVGWLIPRLVKFHQNHPEIEVRLASGGTTLPLQKDWSCAIRRENSGGHLSDDLFGSEVVPVCTPAIAKMLCSTTDLNNVPLIRLTKMPDDWPFWLEAVGAARVQNKSSDMLCESNTMAVEAALNGVGVAVVQLPYVMDAISAGRLCAPFPIFAPKPDTWLLQRQSSREKDASFVAFRAWLTHEATEYRKAAEILKKRLGKKLRLAKTP
jgi:LysR family glycine cleavage system transcriptional activator/LysR family transcriptional regulator of beta-lactamase